MSSCAKFLNYVLHFQFYEFTRPGQSSVDHKECVTQSWHSLFPWNCESRTISINTWDTQTDFWRSALWISDHTQQAAAALCWRALEGHRPCHLDSLVRWQASTAVSSAHSCSPIFYPVFINKLTWKICCDDESETPCCKFFLNITRCGNNLAVSGQGDEVVINEHSRQYNSPNMMIILL